MRYFFRKHQRVVRQDEFTRTLRRGVCVADETLVLFAYPTAVGAQARLGVTIPKKTGSAVVRNRWKRLIRESFRRQQEQIPSGYDFVIRPKKGAQPEWHQIHRSMPILVNKAVARDRQRR